MKHKITSRCFIEKFIDLYSNGDYIVARAEVRCNLVFFLQLSLVHKDKVSKDSESYTDSYT